MLHLAVVFVLIYAVSGSSFCVALVRRSPSLLKWSRVGIALGVVGEIACAFLWVALRSTPSVSVKSLEFSLVGLIAYVAFDYLSMVFNFEADRLRA